MIELQLLSNKVIRIIKNKNNVETESKISPNKNLNSNILNQDHKNSDHQKESSEEAEKGQTNKVRIRTVSFDDVSNTNHIQNCLKTPIHDREAQPRCSTPPTVSPSKSRFMSANQMESK